MKQNLNSKQITINGIEYELPLYVSWISNQRFFSVRSFVTVDGRRKERRKTFFTKQKTVATAYQEAVNYAATVAPEAKVEPAYAVIGVDSKGRPVSLGQGIYMQINSDRGNYQLLKIIHGTKRCGNLRKSSIGLGRMGCFSQQKFDEALARAQRLLATWSNADASASNEQQFQEEQRA